MQAYVSSLLCTRAIPPILKHTSSNQPPSQSPAGRSRNLQHTIHYLSRRIHHQALLAHRNENEHIVGDWKRRCVSNAIEDTAYYRMSLSSVTAVTRRGISGVMIRTFRLKSPIYRRRNGSAACARMRERWQGVHSSSAWVVKWSG